MTKKLAEMVDSLIKRMSLKSVTKNAMSIKVDVCGEKALARASLDCRFSSLACTNCLAIWVICRLGMSG